MSLSLSALANGVRVVTAALPHAESVATGLWVGVGGRHETAAQAGISHFIEHMLFKGTRRRSARELSQAIEGRGGYLNAFTQSESTCYYVRVPSEQAWHGLDVLCDMYRYPAITVADVGRERDVVLEEILMYYEQPQQWVHEMLGCALWRDHPLGRPLSGSAETLRSLGRTKLVRFRRDTYVPENTVLVFAGRVEHDACVAQAARWLGSLRRRPVPACEPVTPRTGQACLVAEERDTEQAHVALGVRLFGSRDPQRYALKLLSVILGENMSSRLFQVVRERHGLAYAVQSTVSLFDDSGTLVISAGLERRRAQRGLELIVKELVKLRSRHVSRGELKRAKDYAAGQFRLNLESTSSRMIWLGESVLARGRVVPPEETIAGLMAVGVDDILDCAMRVLRPRRCSLAVIAAEGDLDARALRGSLDAIGG